MRVQMKRLGVRYIVVFYKKMFKVKNPKMMCLIGFIGTFFLLIMNIINPFPKFSELGSQQWTEMSPLCTEGILSKDTIKVPSWNRLDQKKMPIIHKNNDCRLHYYNKSDFVSCIEALTNVTNTWPNNRDNNVNYMIKNTNNSNNISLKNIKLHVAFIGDSRIHQIFMNFLLSLVPFFEDRCPKSIDDKRYRYDKCGVTPLMDAYFSYLSLPTYDDKYMEAVNGWVQGEVKAPNYLVMGSTAHHIGPLRTKKGIENYPEFVSNITRLASLLNQLEERYGTRMVWWNDDAIRHFDDGPLMQMSQTTRGIFQKNNVPVQMWDSTNDLFVAYVQTCNIADINRQAPWVAPPFISHPNSWIKCKEMTHAPQSYAIIQAQLLANDICNRVM